MNHDRRVRRSDNAHEATGFFLASLAESAGYEAIALANEDGLLINGVGERGELDWLAALSAVGPADLPRFGKEGLQAYPFEIFGHRFHVATVGGKPLPVEKCEGALRRIFAPVLGSC